MNKKTVLWSVLPAAVAVGIAVWFGLARSGAGADPAPGVGAGKAGRTVSRAVPAVPGEVPSVRSAAETKQRRPRVPSDTEWTLDDFDDDDHPYTLADKQVALELQLSWDAFDAVNERELKAAEKAKARGEPVDSPALKAKERFFAAAARAAASANPSVRKEAVDAYSWYSEESLPELTPMMADADAEVSEAAIDAVETALDDLDDVNLRFETAAAYMGTFSVNEDAMEMLSGSMVSSALEIIEAETDDPQAELRALDNRNLVVDTLNNLIRNGKGKCVEAAMEAYNDITSEDWISYDEARRWAQDPDGYEAPETED